MLTLDAQAGEAPLLSVFGGRITTHRRLAEAALARLGLHRFGLHDPWTAAGALPNGDFPRHGAPVRRVAA